jgi:TetR/AcrR family transcriptional regulator, mexJK operon transcriptional repressor
MARPDKRRVILQAAGEAFLRKGYVGTSVDEIAAQAAVSKQTVYKQFQDKERLFNELIVTTMDEVNQHLQAATRNVGTGDDLEGDLHRLARSLIEAILHPDVVALRRLIIGEAARFPELGRMYYERGFERGLRTLGEGLSALARRGLLRVDDPVIAANHFAGLVMWHPTNRAMFLDTDSGIAAEEIERFAGAAVGAFLSAYGAR